MTVAERSSLVRWREPDKSRWVDMQRVNETTTGRWVATYRREIDSGGWTVMYANRNMVPNEELVSNMTEEDVRDYIYMKCVLTGALNEE